MKFKAIVFPVAIGALALLGACSGADTPAEYNQEPGVVDEQVEPLESPEAVPADPMSPDPSMESPAPTGDVPPSS